MQNSSAKHFPFILIIIFGVMTTFGPLSIDMYSPSLPNVQHDFGSTTSEIQLTTSFAMIGLALGQFFFGPLSDAFGRKKVALTILVIYLLASLIAVFTTSLYFFLFLRLIQGLMAGGSIVIAKASVGDKFSGDEMAKMLTSLMVVNGIITIIAPLLGGFALTISTWRSIFIILTIITLIVIIGVFMKMPPSTKAEQTTLNYSRIFKDFGTLLKNHPLLFQCCYKV